MLLLIRQLKHEPDSASGMKVNSRCFSCVLSCLLGAISELYISVRLSDVMLRCPVTAVGKKAKG